MVRERGLSLAALSRDLLRRNAAYLQQYVTRGSPRLLAEADRALLADYLGIDETVLGGRPRGAVTHVPLLAIGASAGRGRLVDAAARRVAQPLPSALLEQLGVAPAAASMIVVEGDSMAPTLADGDTILVDSADRRVTAAPRLYVLRIDDALMVKRVALADGVWHVTSDNPCAPDPGRFDPGTVALIGRVRWLSREPD
nr:S24 family peptidase [Sphingomonas japonica]